MSGGQWIALDVNYYLSPLALRLRERFGPVGLILWPAFLCACKRSPIQGRITFGSDTEALYLMGLGGLDLVDGNGVKFELDDFWTLLGQLKQTKRTRRGQLSNVTSTHWERWQDDSRRHAEAEKKRRQRAQTKGDTTGTAEGHVPANVPADSDSDSDSDFDPPKPPLGGGADVASLPEPQPGPVAPPDGLRAAFAAAVPTAIDNRTNGRRRTTTEPATETGAEP